jgi:hypothetical protein
MSTGGGGGGGGGDTETTIRYAPYVEAKHSSFLDSIRSHVNSTIDQSPFSDYTDIECDDAFFGTGYVLSSFPSLYDMYGKFMAGLDIDSLYSQLFTDTLETSEVASLVSAEASLLEDEIETNVIPRLQTGMRDINSVVASSFVVGKSLIEDTRVKQVAKFSAELKYRLLPIVTDRWKTHLGWNQNVVSIYAEIMKLYFSAKMDIDNNNYSMVAKDTLWPFTVLAYERAALGALQGAMTQSSAGPEGSSPISGAIGGALSGAASGAMLGSVVPGIGTLAGAIGGGVLGLGMSFL